MNILNVLTKAYTEPHRCYHTLEHIAHMFNVARAHNIELSKAQTHAIWWHDAVYVPGSKDNEDNSCIMMSQYYNSDANYFNVVRMILDTRDHIPHSEESAVVCDLDMFGFVESTTKHQSINRQIEEEFTLAGVTPDDYHNGRIKFLESLLTKPVFHSEVFKKYNKHAQERIKIDITHCK